MNNSLSTSADSGGNLGAGAPLSLLTRGAAGGEPVPGRAARSSTAASLDRAGLSGRDARGLGASEGEDEWASSQRRPHTARVLKLVFRVCRAHENVLLESFSPVATTAASPWEVPSLVLGWRPSPRAARRGRGARLRAHGTSRLLWAVSQSPLSQVGLPRVGTAHPPLASCVGPDVCVPQMHMLGHSPHCDGGGRW